MKIEQSPSPQYGKFLNFFKFIFLLKPSLSKEVQTNKLWNYGVAGSFCQNFVLLYILFSDNMWGGKRCGSGRNKTSDKKWNDYKKEGAKRKLTEAEKSSGNLIKMFKQQSERKEAEKEVSSNSVKDVENNKFDNLDKLLDENEGKDEKDAFEKLIDETYGEEDIHVKPGVPEKSCTTELEEGAFTKLKNDIDGEEDIHVKLGDPEISCTTELEEGAFAKLINEIDGEEDIHVKPPGDPGKDEMRNIGQTEEDKIKSIMLISQLPQPLPFFINGCRDADVSGPNYTCAPDTVFSVIEATVLSGIGGELWQDRADPVLGPALDMIRWRLDNNFSWSHQLRDEYWKKLCQLFPAEFLPKGTVTAAVDKAIEYLSNKAPVKVVFSVHCLSCEGDMGWFQWTFEGPLILSTENLKKVPENLSELCLVMISRHLKQLLSPGAERIRCTDCGSWGGRTPSISTSNLLLPSVIMLGFLVKTRVLKLLNVSWKKELSSAVKTSSSLRLL